MDNETRQPLSSELSASSLSPLSTAAKGNSSSNKPYEDWNICEKGYNATANLLGYNMLKDTKEPFHIVVEEKVDITFMSVYFAGCDKVLRNQCKRLLKVIHFNIKECSRLCSTVSLPKNASKFTT
jgi:hypothetical protein